MLRLLLIGLVQLILQLSANITLIRLVPAPPNTTSQPSTIQQIPLPPGFTRVPVPQCSFGGWLHNIQLKQNKTVYLYNGMPKANQSAHFAVLDVPVGKKDLQQCADAIMRLRATYLFDQKRYDEIVFCDNAGKAYRYTGGNNQRHLDQYLEKIFAYCGTLSLERQLKKVHTMQDIKAGDVFIRGGSPGHAVIVMDVAVNKTGEKIYLVAQSYMPAQDIHILVNPLSAASSPWYNVSDDRNIITPEWTFGYTQLKQW